MATETYADIISGRSQGVSTPASVAAGFASYAASQTPAQKAAFAASVAVVQAQSKANEAAGEANAAAQANDPAFILSNLIPEMTAYLKGLNQAPLNYLQSLTTGQQQAYAQAIKAFSDYQNSLGHTKLGFCGSNGSEQYAVDTSERGISVLTYDVRINGDFDQATLDAQNNKNAQAWCVAQGWSHANNGLPGASYWMGDAGQWARTANCYCWNNVPTTPATCALMDLDINSQVFGDDSIHFYKQSIESFVGSGAGVAYDNVWPAGYADKWNNAFQAAHSKGKLLGQIFGPILIVGGAIAAAFSVGGGAAAAGVGIGITEQAYQTPPPNPGPGAGSSGPIAVAQISAAAASSTAPGPPGSNTTVTNPAVQQTGGAANATPGLASALSSIQQFPWLWGAGAAAVVAILVVVLVE
jgi:hypothetical protein